MMPRGGGEEDQGKQRCHGSLNKEEQKQGESLEPGKAKKIKERAIPPSPLPQKKKDVRDGD